MKLSLFYGLLFFSLNLVAQTDDPAPKQTPEVAEDQNDPEIDEEYRNAEAIDETEERQFAQNQDECNCREEEQDIEAQGDAPAYFPEESVLVVRPEPVVPIRPSPPPASKGPDYTQPQIGPEYYKQYDSGNYQYQSFGPMGEPSSPPMDQFGQPIPQPLGQ